MGYFITVYQLQILCNVNSVVNFVILVNYVVLLIALLLLLILLFCC